MASDQAQLVRRLRKQGFHVQPGGKHYKVHRDGSQFVTMPVTPSDHHSIANTIAKLKEIGYDTETDAKAASRRERALAEARRHNEKIDAQTVDYSDYKKPEPEPEPVACDGPAEGAQYRDITARAMGRVVLTDRTEQRAGRTVVSGQACEECKKPFDQCSKNTLGRSRACCGPCSSYDTHDEQVVKELHLFEPYEGDGNCREAIRFARSWIRHGYHVQNVMRRTGVGFRWLEDLVGADGYLRTN